LDKCTVFGCGCRAARGHCCCNSRQSRPSFLITASGGSQLTSSAQLCFNFLREPFGRTGWSRLKVESGADCASIRHERRLCDTFVAAAMDGVDLSLLLRFSATPRGLGFLYVGGGGGGGEMNALIIAQSAFCLLNYSQECLNKHKQTTCIAQIPHHVPDTITRTETWCWWPRRRRRRRGKPCRGRWRA
jgi:hypothetical protein